MNAILAGIGLLALMMLGAWIALHPQGFSHRRALQFDCPHEGRPVEALMVQDVRTGQWGPVLTCSRFRPTDAITCDRACVAEMNRGISLEAGRPA